MPYNTVAFDKSLTGASVKALESWYRNPSLLMLHSSPSALQQRPIITSTRVFNRQRDDWTQMGPNGEWICIIHFRREYISYLSRENNNNWMLSQVWLFQGYLKTADQRKVCLFILTNACQLYFVLVEQQGLVYKFQLMPMPFLSQTDLIKYSFCEFLARFVLNSLRRSPFLLAFVQSPLESA